MDFVHFFRSFRYFNFEYFFHHIQRQNLATYFTFISILFFCCYFRMCWLCTVPVLFVLVLWNDILIASFNNNNNTSKKKKNRISVTKWTYNGIKINESKHDIKNNNNNKYRAATKWKSLVDWHKSIYRSQCKYYFDCSFMFAFFIPTNWANMNVFSCFFLLFLLVLTYSLSFGFLPFYEHHTHIVCVKESMNLNWWKFNINGHVT